MAYLTTFFAQSDCKGFSLTQAKLSWSVTYLMLKLSWVKQTGSIAQAWWHIQIKHKHGNKEAVLYQLTFQAWVCTLDPQGSPTAMPDYCTCIIQMPGGKTAQIDLRNKQVRTKALMKQTLIWPIPRVCGTASTTSVSQVLLFNSPEMSQESLHAQQEIDLNLWRRRRVSPEILYIISDRLSDTLKLLLLFLDINIFTTISIKLTVRQSPNKVYFRKSS